MSFGEITKEKQDEILSDGQTAGLSQEARENLRTEFVSLGGIVKSKPDVSEVRDFTISAILSKDSLSVTLIMMIDGRWFNIGDYTESPDIRDKLILNKFPNKNKGFNGKIVSDQVGEDVVFGDALHLRSDGKYYKMDADAEATTIGGATIATQNIPVNKFGILLENGYIRDDSWSWTIGGLLYAHTTPGNPTQTAPSGAGDIVRILGNSRSSTVIRFNPDHTFLERT